MHRLEDVSISETEFNSIIADLFDTDNGFDSVGVSVRTLEQDENGEMKSDFLDSQKFTSLEDAKTTQSLSSILTTERAIDKVVEIFGLSNLSDVYNYDPIAQNNIEVQALNSQLENLFTSIPYFLDTMPSSADVLNVIVDKVLSSKGETLALDLSAQEDLELIFEVDNSPSEGGAILQIF